MRPRPYQAANDNAASTGSSALANADAPRDGAALKNILGFLELLDGWDRAANDNYDGMTTAEDTETMPHER